jgi:hypothetical protein
MEPTMTDLDLISRYANPPTPASISGLLELLGTPSQRVSRGAAQLDRWHPSWWECLTRPVQVNTMDDCPLGQCFGTFMGAPAQLRNRAWSYGFADTSVNDGAQLDAAWTLEVARRRGQPLPELAHLIVDGLGSSPAGRVFELTTAGAQ